MRYHVAIFKEIFENIFMGLVSLIKQVYVQVIVSLLYMCASRKQPFK